MREKEIHDVHLRGFSRTS